MSYELTASFHKGTCSSAHLGHNRRTINVPHADKDRQSLNVCYVDMSLEKAYDILFADALARYNKGKKPSRQIKNYLAHIQAQYEKGEIKLQEAKARGASQKEQSQIKSRYPKPFYEVIMSIGNCDSYEGKFRCGGEKEQIAVDILNEYMQDFQERNPNLFVFSAHLHRDESGVPHIHIDYIPFTTEPGRGLPVRLSENGAFCQMGLTSGVRGDIGTVAFQNRERCRLTEIAKKHGVDIVDGRHSKHHLSKEEYILHQEREKSKEAQELIGLQAKELLGYQDEFVDYIRNNGVEEAFSEHIENISLKHDKANYEASQERHKRFLALSWDEYNECASAFFSAYRSNKALLWSELQEARKQKQYNKKRLTRTLSDIVYGTDFLIIKLIKLFAALFMVYDSIRYENQIEELQEANRKLKETARLVMENSEEVSATLRSKDIDNIEKAIISYEQKLNSAVVFINRTVNKTPYLGVEDLQK